MSYCHNFYIHVDFLLHIYFVKEPISEQTERSDKLVALSPHEGGIKVNKTIR